MSKSTKFFLFVVMIAAVALVVCCGLRYLDLGRQLHSFEEQLSESRKSWENIASEKEALQQELEEKTGQLRNAELSLPELEQKAENLKKDIASLQEEISQLKPAEE